MRWYWLSWIVFRQIKIGRDCLRLPRSFTFRELILIIIFWYLLLAVIRIKQRFSRELVFEKSSKGSSYVIYLSSRSSKYFLFLSIVGYSMSHFKKPTQERLISKIPLHYHFTSCIFFIFSLLIWYLSPNTTLIVCWLEVKWVVACVLCLELCWSNIERAIRYVFH